MIGNLCIWPTGYQKWQVIRYELGNRPSRSIFNRLWQDIGFDRISLGRADSRFFDTLQANPDFSATLQEYIQLDFSNFYHELYIREMEIWGFIFFLFNLLMFCFCLFFFFFTYFFNFILFIPDFFRNFARKQSDFSGTCKNNNSNFSDTLQEVVNISDEVRK